MLNIEKMRQLLDTLQQTELLTFYEIKQHNHVYRLEAADQVLFLKLYTKDWYGDDIAGTGYCVDHEVAAWNVLGQAGLAIPQVVHAAMTSQNVLNRPFLLTKQLTGMPLTQLLQIADNQTFVDALIAVGAYMRMMHAIQFPFAGYITSSRLPATLDASSWQHPIWTYQAFERHAEQTWKRDRDVLSGFVLDAIRLQFSQYSQQLAAEYTKPHFTHGDCHASQFFLVNDQGTWQVTGVLDMEVSSAGDCGFDLVKFGLEMSALFAAQTRWWEPFFVGYGHEPAFTLHKLRMLAASHFSYTYAWPGTRAEIMNHVLTAESWAQLYDLTELFS